MKRSRNSLRCWLIVLSLASVSGWSQDRRQSSAVGEVCPEVALPDPKRVDDMGRDPAIADAFPLCQREHDDPPALHAPIENALVSTRPATAQVLDVVMGNADPLVQRAVMDMFEGVLLPPGLDIPVMAPLTAATPATPAEEEIADTVNAWLQAWSARNADAYLAFYSPEFSTGEPGVSFAQWRQRRRERVIKPAWIAVKALDVRVEQAGTDQVRVRFKQDYRSPVLTQVTQKRLLMKRQAGAWRILAEATE